MGNIHVVGPNRAVLVSGGWRGKGRRRMVSGGWIWSSAFVSDVQFLSLELMTLYPMCEDAETATGVQLTVTGVTQCKIMNTQELLNIAAEQFLGKSVREIKFSLQKSMEGHLRAIVATLNVEEVYKERKKFAALVREVAAPDVARMGVGILSFTIRDIFDNVNYLSSLGKARTAEVKRDAAVGTAQADRDAGIKESQCEKTALGVKYDAETKIENHSRMYRLHKSNFDKEVNSAKAEAQLAYELQVAKTHQDLRNEQIQIEIVERTKQTEVELYEVLRMELELNATVRIPADAESYRLRTVAEGKRAEAVEAGKAAGAAIKDIGLAEAYAIEKVGKADAEKKKLCAGAFSNYGHAAITSMVLDSLPKITAEVSAPLSKIGDIVLLGSQ